MAWTIVFALIIVSLIVGPLSVLSAQKRIGRECPANKVYRGGTFSWMPGGSYYDTCYSLDMVGRGNIKGSALGVHLTASCRVPTVSKPLKYDNYVYIDNDINLPLCCLPCDGWNYLDIYGIDYRVTNSGGFLTCESPISPTPYGCPGFKCQCKFPFKYGGVSYSNCTTSGGQVQPWCEVADKSCGAVSVSGSGDRQTTRYWSSAYCPGSEKVGDIPAAPSH